MFDQITTAQLLVSLGLFLDAVGVMMIPGNLIAVLTLNTAKIKLWGSKTSLAGTWFLMFGFVLQLIGNWA